MSTNSTSVAASLPYSEPAITEILIQSSFLIVSNILNHIVNGFLYCGLIGQILVGVAWGTPGGKILSQEAESTIVQMGYLGLILIVFEGGLSTDFRSLKANLLLSTGVAITGIAAPIALSFILSILTNASKLECFAAGAALCSTSLGTTFTVLRSSGLVKSRLGVILASAAMLDDVVGLVMVQIVANMGDAAGPIQAVTVVRPLMVSIAFAAVTPAACMVLIKPFTLAINTYRQKHKGGSVDRVLRSPGTAVLCHTTLLISMVTASSYAGTSNLFAAYIAGAVITWWDTEVLHMLPPDQRQGVAGREVYRHFYEPAVKRILQPFFFGSIGFSIPITHMFLGSVVWKGIVYAVVMCVGKMFCGLWLVRLPGLATRIESRFTRAKEKKIHATAAREQGSTADRDMPGNAQGERLEVEQCSSTNQEQADSTEAQTKVTTADAAPPVAGLVSGGLQSDPPSDTDLALGSNESTLPNPTKPVSLYPAAIIGSAMVARGEIGFLISAVAQSRGVFRRREGEKAETEIFLLVTWAIVLCTIIGPLLTGMLVRLVKSQEVKRCSAEEAASGSSIHAVLGVWGPQ